MSLVNDMLRDLDARRRDAPMHGLGAEKLVPSEERRHKKSGSLQFILLIVVLIIAVVAVFWLLPDRRGSSSGQLAPVQFAPQAVEPVTPAPQVDNEVLIAQAAAAAAAEAVAQLETRLQQLEAQNRALLQAHQTAPQAPSQTSLAPALVPTPSVVQTPAVAPMPTAQSVPAQPVQTTATPVWNEVATGTSQVEPPVQPLVQVAPPAPAVESMTRSPRDLSFEDRERLEVQTALQQWSSGQRLTALQTLDVFSHENPQAHNARETLAKLLIQQGEPERALQAAEVGLAIAPNHNAFRKIKARILLDRGMANETVMLLSQNAPPVPVDSEYHDVLATAYLANGQYDMAVLVYRALLQGSMTEGRWWYGLGAALDAQGYAQDAAQAYERALQQVSLSAPLRQTSQQRLQLIRQNAGL